MNFPTPEDLRQIERAHYRSTMHRKLPLVRACLAEGTARKYAAFPKG